MSASSTIRRVRAMATGWRPPTPAWKGPVEGAKKEEHDHDHRRHGPHEHPLRHGTFAAVGEEEHVDEDHPGDE
jgi:hypothetical protein